MIRLGSEKLCSVENGHICLGFKCPCLISFNGVRHCALDYFGNRGPRTAWYNTEYEKIKVGERPNGDYHLAIRRPLECIRNQTESSYIKLSVAEKETLIYTLHLKWIEYLRFHPSDNWINTTMIDYPEDPPRQWPVVYIPVYSSEGDSPTEIYTTLRCFTPEVDNNGEVPVFAQKGVLEFLLAHNVECVIGTIDRWNFKLDEQEGLPLSTIAVKMDINIGKAFTRFVELFGGALLVEQRRDWCIFQSE